jgi:tetratricopeptide (TPR) repeat protein
VKRTLVVRLGGCGVLAAGVAIAMAATAIESPEAVVAMVGPTEPQAVRAERVFFDALNHHPERRAEALGALWEAAREEPINGSIVLWLGLCHLWIAAESDPGAQATTEHAIVAEHYLRIAQRLNPEDARIASWLAPVRIRLGEQSGDAGEVERAWTDLRAAVKQDPCFHAVAMGIMRFGADRGSAEFKEGLEAMRKAAECAGDDPSIQNRERWPHNLEGFALALAQYELKAGNRQRAESMLMFAQERPGYADWPQRGLVEEQFLRTREAIAAYASPDPPDNPPTVLSAGNAVSCRVCHQTGAN